MTRATQASPASPVAAMCLAAASRRDALAALALGAGAWMHGRALAAEAPSPAASASPAMPPILDTHTHFYNPARPQGVPWPGKNDKLLYRTVLPAEYKKLAQPLGVVGTVIVEASPWLEDNQWLLDLAKDEPFIRGVVGQLAPGAEGFRGHLARFVKNPLFRGIRLTGAKLKLGLDQPAFLADLEAMADADLSLDVQSGLAEAPLALAVAQRVPKLRLVLNHLPYDEPRDPALAAAGKAALAEIAKLPQAYAKVSYVLRKAEGKPIADPAHYKPGLDAIWKLFGPERVVFGSNWPVSDNLAPLPAVLGVVAAYAKSLGPAPAERYFAKNAMAAYRLPAR